jgi:beta-galactosidase
VSRRQNSTASPDRTSELDENEDRVKGEERMSLPITTDRAGFVRAGRPHRIISGAIHYQRVHPELWGDRLARLRALGLNAIETYVPWNLHERLPGVYDFEGFADLERFVALAGETGFDVILRPGPYICAEWDFGGLPAWLLAEGEMQLRCSDPNYLAAVDRWFDVLIPRVLPLLATKGGPIVAVQVENEYGSFGNDAAYLERLRHGLVNRGIDVLLFTSDGPEHDMLASGMVPGVLATANFGSGAREAFRALHEHQPDGPAMCMEFWNGWFDHWGEPHHTRDAADAAAELDEILAAGGSVNLYMAHGGTNFGLWGGANEDAGRHQPTVTSYDYDAAISESGELTPKFWAFREVIGRYAELPDVALPASAPRAVPQSITVTEWGGLMPQLDAFGDAEAAPLPLNMEQLGQNHGLIHYRATVRVPPEGGELLFDGLADRAAVFVNGRRVAIVSRNDESPAVRMAPADAPVQLDLLVENQGRINYGPKIGERKGVRAVRLGRRIVHGWESRPLPIDRPGALDRVAFEPGDRPDVANGPVFGRAAVSISEPADAFIALPGWGKGFLWLNGFLLGRYWEIGPQRTLYAPAPLWRAGANELVILELDRAGGAVELCNAPELG